MVDRARDLGDYYRGELAALRVDAVEFGRDHPEVARELALGGGRSHDPHVELLLQSFAWLAGRLRHDMERERNLVPNAVLEQLYPHLASSIPATAVAEIDVRADGKNFAAGAVLERGRLLRVEAEDDADHGLPCRFRTCFETPLWPLEVAAVGMVPVNRYDFPAGTARAAAVLRVEVARTGGGDIQTFPLRHLRFHLNGDRQDAYRLYDALAAQLEGVAVFVPGDRRPRPLPPDALRWLGFGADEAALPDRLTTQPALRLLQEYFAFPEKFLFFELDGLDLTAAQDRFEVLFLLREPPAGMGELGADALRLNCVPLVNLFPQPLEPVRLDHSKYEYRLSGSWSAHRHCEIHDVESLHAVQPDGRQRRMRAYYALDGGDTTADVFYALRREPGASRAVPGTETYVAFLDRDLGPAATGGDTVGGRALCTNRRLPERLRHGDALALEGPGAVRRIRLLGRPNPHRPPTLTGAQPWALVAQLCLNYLPLDGSAGGLDALRNLLRLHVGADNEARWRQIDGLEALAARPIVHYPMTEYWRGGARGTELRLTVDEESFEHGSAILFGEVLRRVFALFAHVNHFVRLAIAGSKRAEDWKRWPPLSGNQIVL